MKVMTRLEANLRILTLLRKYFIQYPDSRFGQALFSLGILKSGRDPYYQEPADMLQEAEKAYEALEPKR